MSTSVLLDRMQSIIKAGVNAPSLSEKEKDELLHLENVWKKVMDGIKPFMVLFNASDKSEAEIQKSITEVAFGMYFFAARTCDGIDATQEVVRNTLEVTKGQLELAKHEAKSAKVQSFIAIGVAILTLIGGIWATWYWGRCAREDSKSSTTAIVSAIEKFQHQTK